MAHREMIILSGVYVNGNCGRGGVKGRVVFRGGGGGRKVVERGVFFGVDGTKFSTKFGAIEGELYNRKLDFLDLMG